jgi:predicted RNA-binding Zn ribbon-like protein
MNNRPSKHPKSRNVESMRLNAGALCLDFLNTRVMRPTRPQEWLSTYRNLVTFALRTQTLEVHEGQTLLELANQHPDQAEAMTAQAREWRENLYHTVTRTFEPSDLEQLKQSFKNAFAQRHLEPAQTGYAWAWDDLSLERPLWPIILNASELLVSGLSEHVHLCPGHECGWVILDAGRGKPRRWCAMDLCGNRSKVKGFRARLEPADECASR